MKVNGGSSRASATHFDGTDYRNSSALLSERLLPGLVMGSDVLQWMIAGLATYSAYLGLGLEVGAQYAAASFVAAVVTVVLFRWGGLYGLQTLLAWPGNMARCLALSAGSLAIITIIAFALKVSDQFSRTWFFGSWVAASAMICMSRSMFVALIEKWASKGILDRRIAVIGTQEQTRRLLLHLAKARCQWQRVVGIFDDRRTRIVPEIAGHSVRGDRAELERLIRAGRVDDVLIALPWNAEDRITEMVDALRPLPTSTYLCSDLIGYRYDRFGGGGIGLPIHEICAAPMSGWGGVLKNAMDKVIVVTLLTVLAPLMLLIGLLVKFNSSGPVLFHQNRYGFNNELIKVHKFRTMYDTCDPEFEFRQATRDDSRVTPLGRILRRTSLDELPQLLNVLEGNMSLVGPRPHPVELNRKYEALIGHYHARHRVKPGITGWAQINGYRGEIETTESMQGRVEHDIFYIENWSIWLDLWILLRTLFVGFVHKNAY